MRIAPSRNSCAESTSSGKIGMIASSGIIVSVSSSGEIAMISWAGIIVVISSSGRTLLTSTSALLFKYSVKLWYIILLKKEQ